MTYLILFHKEKLDLVKFMNYSEINLKDFNYLIFIGYGTKYDFT
jgi:hypothetical protein